MCIKFHRDNPTTPRRIWSLLKTKLLLHLREMTCRQHKSGSCDLNSATSSTLCRYKGVTRPPFRSKQDQQPLPMDTKYRYLRPLHDAKVYTDRFYSESRFNTPACATRPLLRKISLYFSMHDEMSCSSKRAERLCMIACVYGCCFRLGFQGGQGSPNPKRHIYGSQSAMRFSKRHLAVETDPTALLSSFFVRSGPPTLLQV